MKVYYLSIFLFLTTVLSAFGVEYTVESVPNVQKQRANAYVTNPDGILSAEAVARIDGMIAALRDSTTAEVAVVVLNSIGATDIESFATDLFAHWGIGNADKDNGLLLLFVNDQRKIRFEVGYGMEGVLPDAICKRIQSQRMIPYFREGNYNQGMVAGVATVVDILSSPEAAQELFATQSNEQLDFWKTLLRNYLLFMGVVTCLFLFYLYSVTKQTKGENEYSQYLSLNSARRYTLLAACIFPFTMLWVHLWLLARLHRLRNKKRICSCCNTPMRKLNEEEDNNYLSPQENTEELLKSVDYDVWLCSQCGDTEVYRYDKVYSNFTTCPYCQAKAFRLTCDHIVAHPTHFSQGAGEKKYSCNHCHREQIQRYAIPMIVAAPIGGRRGGGGFGGSGFGGGFGGGSSGGGGATSGW